MSKQLHTMGDEELEQLRVDSLDDFTWKSGSQYARILSELCEAELAARKKDRTVTGDDGLAERIRKRMMQAQQKQAIVDGSG